MLQERARQRRQLVVDRTDNGICHPQNPRARLPATAFFGPAGIISRVTVPECLSVESSWCIATHAKIKITGHHTTVQQFIWLMLRMACLCVSKKCLLCSTSMASVIYSMGCTHSPVYNISGNSMHTDDRNSWWVHVVIVAVGGGRQASRQRLAQVPRLVWCGHVSKSIDAWPRDLLQLAPTASVYHVIHWPHTAQSQQNRRLGLANFNTDWPADFFRWPLCAVSIWQRTISWQYPPWFYDAWKSCASVGAKTFKSCPSFPQVCCPSWLWLSYTNCQAYLRSKSPWADSWRWRGCTLPPAYCPSF